MARYRGAVALLFCGWAAAQTPAELFKAHQYPELAAVTDASSPKLYRGTVASAKNESRIGEKLLRDVIRSAPHSEDAYEAHEQLAHLYLRTGQYRRLMQTMDARWRTFPDKPSVKEERTALAPFRGLPDQKTVKRGLSSFRHKDDIFLPVTTNGVTGSYFFDTGAAVSCLSESEARRLGLTIHDSGGTLSTATGGRTGFRTAVAEDLRIGNMRFRDVSFAVFPDDVQPWKELEPGRRGLLGRPVLLGFETLRWKRNGTVEIGFPSSGGVSNLYFDQDAPVLRAGFQDQTILATLDTGAETSDLYLGFYEQFRDLVDRLGTKESKKVEGVGTMEIFESMSIPELRFRIGGSETVLRPAHVLMKKIGSSCCVGNFGIDLLRQGRDYVIDFRAMTVRVER